MFMKINFWLSIFTFLVSMSLFADSHSPNNEDSLNLAPSLRVVVQNPSSTFLGEYNHTQLENNQRVNNFAVAYRYRLASHTKVGVRVTLKSGLLHDSDWIQQGGISKWQNTEDRFELIPSLEYQYRIILDFIPGENWVGELRSNIDYNSHLGEIFLRPRVGINFFGFSEGRPIYNFFARLTPYIRISNNFGDLYEFGTYAGFAYHFTPLLQVSISHQFVQQKWLFFNNIEAFKNNHILGLNLNFLVSLD